MMIFGDAKKVVEDMTKMVQVTKLFWNKKPPSGGFWDLKKLFY